MALQASGSLRYTVGLLHLPISGTDMVIISPKETFMMREPQVEGRVRKKEGLKVIAS
jgi:hypothetical protein